jgi:hypothetical protein
MDEIASQTRADIFLLEAKSRRKDSDSVSFNGGLEKSMDQRLRILVYSDGESLETAKTRLLIMIDQVLQRQVDTIRLELSLQNLVSGRHRKNIKMIESATGTAIYFPPVFPALFGYTPNGSVPLRNRDEIIITGGSMENILQAKKRLHDLVVSIKTFVKDVHITTSKVDFILLERLDKIRKIVEANGSYALLPPLGNHSGVLRVQATDILNVERTVREIMGLTGQFYSASWWVTHPDPAQRLPTPADIQTMLPDICINSGCEITFEKLNFHINGSDDAVKAALSIINTMPFVKKAQSTLRVKVELANEHKEFVSGKKNGKINKIMSQSNVQIVFDGFNEYNFYIDVRGAHYEATKNGLDLVELEMPASISFHVPDQYHKRIIGIGGQHIQRIMKKYSVFVKFSNAMDRGGVGKDDDDIKVDNVICRTPARNADNLELVKQEIMDMVEKVDAEFVIEQVPVDRLYHRELITRMPEIEELEKKWNCKIMFPGTEQASDIITVSGPEYQVPQAVDEFLGMVPENHEIEFPLSDGLRKALSSEEFRSDTVQKLKDQYVVEVSLGEPKKEKHGNEEITIMKLVLSYTRNNAGGLKDAIDFLLLPLMARGLDVNNVKGAIPRPKSDSFEDSMPYFESKLLQRAEPPIINESPTRPTFEDGTSRSIFDKLRKPSSMASFSSFIDRRRKNGTNSPASSLFMHASNNASKASLVSMESRDSGYRNPWNDSGIGIDIDHPDNQGVGTPGHAHANSWGSFVGASSASRPNTSSASLVGASAFPFGANPNVSTNSLSTPMIPGLGMVDANGVTAASMLPSSSATPGDVTPKYDEHSLDGTGRSTSVAAAAAAAAIASAAARPSSSPRKLSSLSSSSSVEDQEDEGSSSSSSASPPVSAPAPANAKVNGKTNGKANGKTSLAASISAATKAPTSSVGKSAKASSSSAAKTNGKSLVDKKGSSTTTAAAATAGKSTAAATKPASAMSAWPTPAAAASSNSISSANTTSASSSATNLTSTKNAKNIATAAASPANASSGYPGPIGPPH